MNIRYEERYVRGAIQRSTSCGRKEKKKIKEKRNCQWDDKTGGYFKNR